jgi:hypothetical protein
MRRRTILFGAPGLTASLLSPASIALAQNSSAQVRQFVRERQEREYLRLADALGLNSARSAYEKITHQSMSAESKAMPTPYEDPRMYAIATKTFDSLSRDNDSLGGAALPHPFFATLPSGDVEARITEEPATKTPIVFIEHGLYAFFYDMAKLTAWASPPLTEAQMTDDNLLARLPRSYTMPVRASENFVASLYAYAVSGSPVATSSPMPEPSQNLALAIRLLNHMERFVMAHELAHIRQRHFDKPPTPEIEYEADSLGVSLVTTLADAKHRSWAVGYWGSELAIISLNLLYRTIGLFTFGNDELTWISRTHPDPLTRRENLRGIWLNPRSPKAGVTAAREVSGMTQTLFLRLWQIALPAFLNLYARGARASPRWRKTAERWQAAKA